ncbi:hypothetical protein H6S82_00115 [Planktothrix sp. FACHB-1355]|uniref:Uncharacterized protein n=1 Tax=Aerosakkonema funiforme FACHB-1375 TaxID=2949571 RepID=A0A926VFL5_9CYAN|nr:MULTISPECIES: hypothetical protein [Oscillatoriales]MBD2181857.1 hypothetical protein [Aerosakkonema funiforme FACHB-1375]MBD3557277.1 hypothetical protein [Planktothrix sp. FACHB-1355]
MPDIFTGSQGDAVNLIEQWRHFLEELLRSETEESNPEARGLQIYDNDRLVYGMERETNQFKDEVTGLVGQVINPELLGLLEKLRDTPVGGLIPEAANKRIELDGRIILQSDRQGKVIINEIMKAKSQENFTEQSLSTVAEPNSESVWLENKPLPSPPEEEDYYSPIELGTDSSLPILESEKLWSKSDRENNLQNSYDQIPIPVEASNTVYPPNPELLSAIREGIKKGNYQIINQAYTGVPYQEKQQLFNSLTPEEQKEARLLKLIHQVEELSGITDGSIHNFVREAMQKQSKSQPDIEHKIEQASEKSQSISGYEKVQRSLAALPQTASVQMAANYSTEMQTLLETIQEQNQQINSLQNSVSQMQQLITARVEQPTQFSWWQQAKQTVTNLWEDFKRREECHTYANAIRSFYSQKVPPDRSTIYVANYVIQRDGKNYTLSDRDGQTVLKFRASGLGVRVDSNVRLHPEQERDLTELVMAQIKGRQPGGAFAVVGQQEVDYYLRIQKLSSALVNYAKSQNSAVEIDGKLSYKWKATTEGVVEIHSKDGRGLLLVQSGGKMVTQLSERDLAYFEAILPKLRAPGISLQPKKEKSRDKEIGD